MKKPETKEVAEDKFVLKIDASDTSWVKIVIDGEDIREYILNPNSTKNFEASTAIDLTLGNSGGITLFLNNEKLNFSGARGRVRNLRINENGIVTQGSN